MGSARVSLEADADHDGVFEAIVGDTVAPGADLRVRAFGLLGQGLVQVRANGKTILENAPLAPGGEVRLTAPDEPGWVRASLLLPDGKAERAPHCPPDTTFGTDDLNTGTYCRNHWIQVGLTSPIYLARPVVPIATALEVSAATHGSQVTATARLHTGDGQPLANEPITFTVGGHTATTSTDASGTAVATLVVEDHGRSQVLTASFAGDSPYEPSQATTTARWGRN
jgi:hypothetical protein